MNTNSRFREGLFELVQNFENRLDQLEARVQAIEERLRDAKMGLATTASVERKVRNAGAVAPDSRQRKRVVP